MCELCHTYTWKGRKFISWLKVECGGTHAKADVQASANAGGGVLRDENAENTVWGKPKNMWGSNKDVIVLQYNILQGPCSTMDALLYCMAGKTAAIKTQAKRDDRWTYGRTKNLAGIVFSDSLTFFRHFTTAGETMSARSTPSGSRGTICLNSKCVGWTVQLFRVLRYSDKVKADSKRFWIEYFKYYFYKYCFLLYPFSIVSEPIQLHCHRVSAYIHYRAPVHYPGFPQ